MRDLRVHMDAMRGSVYHYRGITGFEADAVLALPDGRWALVGVKMEHSKIDEGTKYLLKLANRVDADHEGAPTLLMVITATEAAHGRSDGVLVAPLARLVP